MFTLGNTDGGDCRPAPRSTGGADSWPSLNILTGGVAPSAFKGFAGVVTLPTTTPPAACVQRTGRRTGGNSPPPPRSVPSYMGVIVAKGVNKSGSTIIGNYVKIVVVKTNPGYAPGPSNAGTGTIVATFCK